MTLSDFSYYFIRNRIRTTTVEIIFLQFNLLKILPLNFSLRIRKIRIIFDNKLIFLPYFLQIIYHYDCGIENLKKHNDGILEFYSKIINYREFVDFAYISFN